MHTKPANTISITFKHLHTFAQYILLHKLNDYVAEQIRISREVNVPVLKHLENLSEKELTDFLTKTSTEFLQYLAQNQAEEFIKKSLDKWVNNHLEIVDQGQVQAEDITLISYVRKQTFMILMPGYCKDMNQMMELVKELDWFILQFEKESTNTFVRILKDRIDEHNHFIQKINNTSPVGIYVFDLINFKNTYANEKLETILGFPKYKLFEQGKNALKSFVHPDDLSILNDNLLAVANAKDKEILSYKYRTKSGNTYKWVRHYESVFKRTEDGKVSEVIGIAIDVDKEKKIAEQLQIREQQLLVAQEIAQIGSFVWDFENKSSEGTEQLYKILEVEPNDFESFINKVHPADKEKVKQRINESLKTGVYDCEYRYLGKEGEKVIWSRGIVNYANGTPVSMNGTVMNVTERHQFLNELKRKEELFKQAEALSHIGHWSWNIVTNKISWSDEMYAIFQIHPGKEISFDEITKYNHPEDATFIGDIIEKAITDKEPYDMTYRIIFGDGKQKTLQAKGQPELDENGSCVGLYGTLQDITEKQELIDNLTQSKKLYKQAQALARVGNWSWNMETGELFWSDELFRIYGLDPGKEKITYEKYITLIHPEDVEKVQNQIKIAAATQHSWEFTHKLIRTDGSVHHVFATGEVLTKNEKPYMMIGTAQDITERQNLVEQLQKSESLYKQAQALAHIGNWSWNIQTGKVEWSDELYRIYEIEPGTEISYELVSSFIHPEDKEEVTKALNNSVENGIPYNKHHRIVTNKGNIKTIHRKAEVLLDENGKPQILVGTTQDVTEQQRVQQELKDNQTFLRKLTDATPSIITSYNINTGKYVFVSEGLEKLLGYKVENALEDGVEFFIGLIHPDDVFSLMDKNAKALEQANKIKDKDLVAEFTYRMKDIKGEYRWFHTYGTIFDRNKEGLVEHVLNISLDVTEQVEATNKIKEQEYFIQQVADASPTVLYIYDVETNSFTYANREIYYVLDYTPDELIALGSDAVSTFYHADDIDLLPERKGSSKKFQFEDSMMQYECRMKAKDGSWKWVLVREIIFKKSIEDGHVMQILGAALDITSRKEMEQTLIQNSFKLKQSNSSLEEFAYVASHDLKEPLRKISTFGDRLINTQTDKLTDDGKIYLKKIIDSSYRMQTMINDLLSISMISGDRSFQRTSLQTILEEVLQTLEFKIEQKNATINFDKLPEADIVPSQFRQLFQNILSNSLKFVKEDVKPLITITHQYIGQEEIIGYQLAKKDRYLKIQIIDNGIGFEDEYAGKIFAIFQRLHGRSEYEGTGIGLAICKKIVEHHGGIIYATSKLGEGAQFTIILPV